MKYLVRVLKYYIYIVVIMSLILVLLSLLGLTGGSSIDEIFRNGYDSLWQIALMFLIVAAVYPKFGFNRRSVIIPGEYGEIRDGVVKYMEEKGYVLETEKEENLTFRAKSPLRRATRMFEDRVTFTRDLGGFLVEGITKDIVRIISGLEYKFRNPEV